ncbi:hypothetical protein HK100_011650 [Physocladia obscura]|uniref:Uncharacterized protein n=1 Tax=Physocladia obscura TaxID=109957 RepID=A0AAD5T6X1_9FUNG|nr:hypothetical protein HK100_011650 [Physocladia obscura]
MFDFVGGTIRTDSLSDINSDLINFLSTAPSMSPNVTPQFHSPKNGVALSLYSFQQQQQQQRQQQSALHLVGGFNLIPSQPISSTSTSNTTHTIAVPHIQQQQQQHLYVFDSIPGLPPQSRQSPFLQPFIPQQLQQHHQFISLQQQEQQPQQHPHLFGQLSQQVQRDQTLLQSPSIRPTIQQQQQKWINIDSIYNPASSFTVPSQSYLTMPSPPFSCILPPNMSSAIGFNMQTIPSSSGSTTTMSVPAASRLTETSALSFKNSGSSSSSRGSPQFSVARGQYDENDDKDALVQVVQQQQTQQGNIGNGSEGGARVLTGVSFTAADLSRGNVADILKLGSRVGFGGCGDGDDFQPFLE